MPIEFDCPTCSKRIRTPDEAAGKKARCPTCQTIVPIPYASTAPQAEGFGAFGSAPAPLPSATKAPPPSPPPHIGAAAAKANPPTAPMPWLPPSDAFAPKGPPAFGGPPSYGGYAPPPTSSNPFSDNAGNPSAAGIPSYASSSPYGSLEIPALSREEIRGRLLGPAIGITLGAALSLLTSIGFGMMILMDEEFHQEVQAGGDPAATFFAYLIFAVLGFVAIVPSLVSLIGAWAMFRGRGLVAAWSGAIATILPCNGCFFIGGAFAIWAMIVLSDSRVQEGMK